MEKYFSWKKSGNSYGNYKEGQLDWDKVNEQNEQGEWKNITSRSQDYWSGWMQP